MSHLQRTGETGKAAASSLYLVFLRDYSSSCAFHKLYLQVPGGKSEKACVVLAALVSKYVASLCGQQCCSSQGTYHSLVVTKGERQEGRIPCLVLMPGV